MGAAPWRPVFSPDCENIVKWKNNPRKKASNAFATGLRHRRLRRFRIKRALSFAAWSTAEEMPRLLGQIWVIGISLARIHPHVMKNLLQFVFHLLIFLVFVDFFFRLLCLSLAAIESAEPV